MREMTDTVIAYVLSFTVCRRATDLKNASWMNDHRDSVRRVCLYDAMDISSAHFPFFCFSHFRKDRKIVV